MLVLQFISGVYLPFTQLPDWLQDVASVFPLRWMASGMRSVFLPSQFASAEPGGAWHLGWGTHSSWQHGWSWESSCAS